MEVPIEWLSPNLAEVFTERLIQTPAEGGTLKISDR